jgi:Fe-S cluster assembly protein SufD
VSSLALETDPFRSGFERLSGSAGDPSWLREMRHEAMERFTALGFPSTRDEAWKYTSVAALARTRFREAAALEATALPRLSSIGLPCLQSLSAVVFLNGRFEARLSTGIRVRSLKEALRKGAVELEGVLGRLSPWRSDAFAALNTAFLEDGALIEIPKGAILTDPIVVVYVSTGEAQSPTVSHPRTLVLAGGGSQSSLVEIYVGPAGEAYFTNAVTEVVLEEGAILELARVQLESEAAYHVERLSVRQERSSRLTCHNFSFGASLSRSDISVLLAAPGGECELNGLFFADGDQHTDTETRIVHAQPHCSSRELFKGVLGGRARGVFAGTIVVEKNAQKTDARQTNRNLLLSSEALVDSIPRLEILADDVKCKHGSATGQLDANSLFYLRSRGLDEREARSLLILAFGRDLVQRVKVDSLRRDLEVELGSRLSREGQGVRS